MKANITFFLTLVALFIFSGSLYSNVAQITSEQKYHTLKTNNSSLIVQCYADWCPACVKAKPSFDSLSNHEACKNITFARIDIDALPQIKSQLSLIGVPTFVFIHNNKVVHTEIGIKNFDEFESNMINIANKVFN